MADPTDDTPENEPVQPDDGSSPEPKRGMSIEDLGRMFDKTEKSGEPAEPPRESKPECATDRLQRKELERQAESVFAAASPALEAFEQARRNGLFGIEDVLSAGGYPSGLSDLSTAQINATSLTDGIGNLTGDLASDAAEAARRSGMGGIAGIVAESPELLGLRSYSAVEDALGSDLRSYDGLADTVRRLDGPSMSEIGDRASDLVARLDGYSEALGTADLVAQTLGRDPVPHLPRPPIAIDLPPDPSVSATREVAELLRDQAKASERNRIADEEQRKRDRQEEEERREAEAEQAAVLRGEDRRENRIGRWAAITAAVVGFIAVGMGAVDWIGDNAWRAENAEFDRQMVEVLEQIRDRLPPAPAPESESVSDVPAVLTTDLECTVPLRCETSPDDAR